MMPHALDTCLLLYLQVPAPPLHLLLLLLLSRHFTRTPSLLVHPIDSHSFCPLIGSAEYRHTTSVYNIPSSWLSHPPKDCLSRSTRSHRPTPHPHFQRFNSARSSPPRPQLKGQLFLETTQYTLANPAPKKKPTRSLPIPHSACLLSGNYSHLRVGHCGLS
ncbi:hypothetical protein EDB81DRAFT_156685 [Dactylonectria macrodidyma]|uniref:Uncharacterized protein n=1 Tax=Dactylonectria macrodidyma TaxID=307937 RepID=A0A9P9FQS1_9HYPO|nr:hypothetical protein EDB81DRAFT_156685 [Dactylonectria macrodidyma]